MGESVERGPHLVGTGSSVLSEINDLYLLLPSLVLGIIRIAWLSVRIM